MNEKLTAVLSKIFEMPVAQIKPELSNKDISKWDSLTHMDLITSLEENFKVEFDFDEIVSMTSVAQIESVLKTKGI
jgi:acyl carrier protein